MNILFLTPSYFPIRGGTEQVIYELVSRLKAFHTIKILTLRWEKKWEKLEIIDSVEVYRVGFLNIKGLSLYFKYLSFFLAALRLNKSFKFDIIHMFHVYECGGAAYLLKKMIKTPLIITLAGWDTFSPIRKIPNKYLPVIKATMNAANIVTAPSRHLAVAGKNQGCKRKIEVIPHGSSMHQKILSKNKDIIDELNIRNKKVILSVQRLNPVKGTEYLLKAIPEIIRQHNDIVFIIIGDGQEEKKLKNCVDELNITPYVIFTGFIEQDKLPFYYSIGDLFVLPSLYESFGLVYIDALCFGIPIVTTENGGSLDIINKENGILVPPKDSIKLSEAVIEALNKKWDRNTIKESAEKYRWENIVKAYCKLYKNFSTK